MRQITEMFPTTSWSVCSAERAVDVGGQQRRRAACDDGVDDRGSVPPP